MRRWTMTFGPAPVRQAVEVLRVSFDDKGVVSDVDYSTSGTK